MSEERNDAYPRGIEGRMRVPTAADGSVDAERFKRAFRHHAAGVAVITAATGDGPVALTASSVTSVSAEPPVLLFSVSAETRTGRALIAADTAVVHLLDAGDHALAVRCADPSADRFGDPSTWTTMPSGEPSFLRPRILLRGRVTKRILSGHATVLMLEVVEVIDRRPDGAVDGLGPLIYHDRRWHTLDADSRIG